MLTIRPAGYLTFTLHSGLSNQKGNQNEIRINKMKFDFKNEIKFQIQIQNEILNLKSDAVINELLYAFPSLYLFQYLFSFSSNALNFCS